MIADYYLSIIGAISSICLLIHQVFQFAIKVRSDERGKMLQLSAYFVKAPAMNMSMVLKSMRKEMDSLGYLAVETIRRLAAATTWMFNTSDKILAVFMSNILLREERKTIGGIKEHVVNTIRGLFHDTMNPKGLRLEIIDKCDHSLACIVDLEALNTAVYSLYENARKASFYKGEVLVAFATTADTFEITIRDEGKGCDSERIGRITEPGVCFEYSQGKHEPPDTGFGLTVAERIIKAHKGALTFRSSTASNHYFEAIISIPVCER